MPATISQCANPIFASPTRDGWQARLDTHPPPKEGKLSPQENCFRENDAQVDDDHRRAAPYQTMLLAWRGLSQIKARSTPEAGPGFGQRHMSLVTVAVRTVAPRTTPAVPWREINLRQGMTMTTQLELRSRAALCKQLATREPENRVFWMAEAENWLRLSNESVAANQGKGRAAGRKASSPTWLPDIRSRSDARGFNVPRLI